jgi:hypothetical protein
MTAQKEFKEKLMKARHYLQVSSEIIGKDRYPDKKITSLPLEIRQP